MSSTSDVLVDAGALRDQVREKYRAVATDPAGPFHFHTGRALARRLGYDADAVAALPDRAVESFAGVANPFRLRRPAPGAFHCSSFPRFCPTPTARSARATP